MKTRLLCLALCLTMILTLSLTSCIAPEEEDTKVQMTTSTIVMALITEDGTTDEAVEEIEDAINAITEGKFEIRVELEVYTEDEYYAAIEGKLTASAEEAENVAAARKAYDDFKKAHRKEYKETSLMVSRFLEENADHPEWKEIVELYVYGDVGVDPDDLTYINEENGRVETVFPALKEDQIDIFFLGDYDKFVEYVNNKWLADLSGQLGALSTFLPPAFANAPKVNGATYAVASNTVLGDYTYLLVNKEMCKKYLLSETYFTDKNLTSVSNEVFKKFLDDIATYESEKFDPLKSDSKSEMNLVKYWSIDTETYELLSDFSVIGSIFNSETNANTELVFENLLENENYVNELLALKSFEYNGYYAAEDSEKPFAAGIVTGDKTLEIEYGDEYDMIVLAKPMAGEEDLYSNMFAINANTSNPIAKCVQLITFFQTDEDARNLLLYGVEGVNYEIDKNGRIERLEDNKYFMDIFKTGNVLIAHPETYMPDDIWEYVMDQNAEAVINPVNGFRVTEKDGLDVEIANAVNAASKHCLDEINKCKTLEELTACIETLKAELKLNEAVLASIGGKLPAVDGEEGEETTTEGEGEGDAADTTTEEETTTEAPDTTESPEEDDEPVLRTLYEIYTAWVASKK